MANKKGDKTEPCLTISKPVYRCGFTAELLHAGLLYPATFLQTQERQCRLWQV